MLPQKYINTIPLDEGSPECVLLDKKRVMSIFIDETGSRKENTSN